MLRKTTKITALTFETVERLIVTAAPPPTSAWCARCTADVCQLSPAQAAAATGLTQRKIFCLIEENRIHFSETEDGHVLVCQNSLYAERSDSDV